VRNNCIGLVDLLCAYADGELTESNKQLVEDHLTICENCSAILRVYREMPNSVSETNVPAPEALRIGVMNRIESERIPVAEEKVKKRERKQILLTRYAPIAAGLVVMLLAWQFWGDIWGARDSTHAPAPAAAPAALNEMPAPAADMAPAPAPAPETALRADFDDMFMEEEAQLDAGSSLYDSEAPAEATVQTTPPVPEGVDRSPQETERILAYISGAYAEIAITGELPDLLADREPRPFIGSWFGWEMVFEIESSEVPALLEEVSDREGVIVAYHNSNSKYAVVLFSPGD